MPTAIPHGALMDYLGDRIVLSIFATDTRLSRRIAGTLVTISDAYDETASLHQLVSTEMRLKGYPYLSIDWETSVISTQTWDLTFSHVELASYGPTT